MMNFEQMKLFQALADQRAYGPNWTSRQVIELIVKKSSDCDPENHQLIKN